MSHFQTTLRFSPYLYEVADEPGCWVISAGETYVYGVPVEAQPFVLSPESEEPATGDEWLIFQPSSPPGPWPLDWGKTEALDLGSTPVG